MVDYEKTRFGTEECLDLRDCSLRVLKTRRALEALNGTKGGRLLDLGCGEGALARTLQQVYPQAEVHGCDISVNQLARAEAIGGRVAYANCGGGLPYPDGYFDAVFVMDVLEHVEDPRDFLASVHRILRAGGLLLLHCPCEGQPLTLHWLFWKLGIVPDLKRQVAGHIQRFTHRSTLALAADSGFSRERLLYSYHPFGQAFDLFAFWRQKCQTDIQDGRAGWAKRALVSLPWYRVFPSLERLAGLESRFFGRIPLAMGIDACFTKR